MIGRPNAGKSSLVNAFLGSDRVIVSDRAGTTRDAIDTELEVDGRPVILVDTAGLRRRSKVAGSVDYYAQLRSERAVERADVALVVCDAGDGVTAEDLRVAEMAMKAGCATLMALNKWDVTRTDIDDARARVAQKLRLRPDVVTCLGDCAAATSPTCCPRRWRSPTAPPSGSRPRSSTASSPSSSPKTRRPRAAAAACASTTRPRSARARRASRSRSTTAS